MPFIFQYLLKLSLTLAVMYLFYYILLWKLTFYRWNRFYLLCYSLLSFVIPFINITPWIADQPIAGNVLMNRVMFMNKLPAEHAFSWWPWLSALFAAGVLVMLARLVMQLISIWSLRRKATLVRSDHVNLYDVDGPISPFSFAQSIFINTRLHTGEELQRIMQHEFVHVKQQHTIDLLMGELLCIVNWYNPFAWLIKKAIRQNLEFIADNSVLQTGIDARHYQYLLLKVTGLTQYSVSSNFNISSLKQRIVMINKLRSARVHLLKFMFVLPLLAFVLVAFRGQQERKRQEAELLLHESVSPVSDTVPKKSSSPKFQQPRRITRFLKEHQSVEDVDWKNNNTSGNTVILKLKNGKSETYDLSRKEENEDFIKKYGASLVTPPPPPPVPSAPGAPAKDKQTVMLESVNEEKEKLDYLAEKAANDKQKASDENVEKATYDEQKAIYEYEKTRYDKQKVIYEKEKASYKKKYGNIPNPPVPPVTPLSIITNPVNMVSASDTTDPVSYFQSSGNATVSIKNMDAALHAPLYVVDGLVVNASEFSTIDPGEMESIDVLKGKSATSLYGDKGVNGVVMITTKNNSQMSDSKAKSPNDNKSILQLGSLKNYNVLLIVDGIEMTSEALNKINRSSIENIEILKGSSSTVIYGEKGKEGAILITLKKNASVK